MTTANRLLAVSFLYALAAAAQALGGEIHQAAEKGELSRVRELLAANPDLLRTTDTNGATPLHAAFAHPDVVSLLLDRGAAVAAPAKDDFTPLHVASFYGARRTVELLLERGGTVNGLTAGKQTPLMLAAQNGHAETVLTLLTNRADPTLKDRKGNTALHVAAVGGHLPVVEFLVRAGANVHDKNQLGFKPVDLVMGSENDKLADFLEAQMQSTELPPIVGELGDPDRLRFHGVTTFRDETIRKALLMSPEYLLAAHFAAPFNEYVMAVSQLIRRGYEENGFPEPKVSVTFNRTNQSFTVHVVEGPRYRRGEIRVTGGKTLTTKELAPRLTQPWPADPASALGSALTSASPKTGDEDGVRISADARLVPGGGAPGMDQFGRQIQRREAAWPIGMPAPFTTQARTRLHAAVTNVLPELGLFFAQVNVRVEPDKASETALLIIDIVDEGPQGEVSEIVITGNKRDSRDDILQFLNLKPGMQMSAGLIQRLEETLWNCARFNYSAVKPSIVDRAANRLALHIELEEYPYGTPLLEKFSPTEQLALKAREWFAAFPARQEDLVLSLTNLPAGLSSAQLGLSPHGAIFVLKGHDSNGMEQVRQSLVVAPGVFGFFSPDRKRKLMLPALGYQLTGFLSVLPERDPDKNPFSVTAGAGFGSATDVTNGMPPFQLQLTLAPVAFINLVRGDKYTSDIADGVLTLNGSNSVIRVATDSGQLLQWTYSGEPGGSVMVLSNYFTRESRALTNAMAQTPNAYQPERPLSSGVAYLFRELADGVWIQLMGSAETNRAAEHLQDSFGLLSKLLDKDILAPLDELIVQRQSGSGEPFSIPMDFTGRPQNPMQGLFTLGAALVHRMSGDLFPPRSWPWTVPREAVFVLSDQSKYTGLELERLYESPDTGPVGFWVIAQLLSHTSSPHGRSFAARGLNRLDLAQFHKDCRLVLEGQPPMVATMKRIVAACASLTNEEVEELVQSTESETTRHALRVGIKLLRTNKDKPLKEGLQPVLDLYWETSLKATIEKSLKELLEPPAEKKA